MTRPALSRIEETVGTRRHPSRHIAHADSTTCRVTILHPVSCQHMHDDLRDCRFEHALDHGIDPDRQPWADALDRPVLVAIFGDGLIPEGDAP